MQLTDVILEIDGPIAQITLDRPEARNAYSDAMIDSLVGAFDAVEADPSVRCIVLTGAGKAFSAGGDLKAMRDKTGMFAGGPADLRARYIARIQQIPRRLARCALPIVAAVNGPAIGAGLDLACMCDLRIAAEGARFGSTFTRVGLVPGDGGAWLLQRVIGLPKALDLMLTARLVKTDEALAMGLVNRVVPPEQLLDEARTTATHIASNSPLAVRLTKRAAYQAYETSLEAALEQAATYQGIVQNTEDHLEAVAALLEKRTPNFTGH
ncbi:MAG: enoyl-CoA hydratase-related protein [Bradymonadia bacterium]